MRQPPRKLTVLASIDVAGYTRMVQRDERKTLTALATVRREILDPLLATYSGDMFKTMGDGGLIEFPSVEDSVRWAIDFQTTMGAWNKDKGEDALNVRVAVALADVVVADGDRYGAAVAFTVRLQEAAPPGGVLITHSVYWQLLKALQDKFNQTAPLTLRSVDQAMEAWCWMPEGVAAPSELRVSSARPSVVRVHPQAPPDRPSIAVLALDNLSTDIDADIIADGVVEEITATLSRIRDFTVIARNSAYVYKGKRHDIREIGRALGVRYVLEGSLRKHGTQIRVTAQLIDTETGAHVWANTYSGTTEDIFALQDRIAEAVAGALSPSIRAAEIEQAKRKRPESLAAYDLVLRAMPHLWASNQHENEEAIRLLDQAVSIDPKYYRASTFAAWARAQQVLFGWTSDVETARREGAALADRAAAMGSDDPTALTALATAAMLLSGDLDRAEMLIDRALKLDPNSAWAWSRRGFIMIDRGNTDEATRCFERALKLSPLDPLTFNAYLGLGMTAFAAGDDARAIDWARRGIRENVAMTWAERDLAAFLGAAGRTEEAQVAVRRLLIAHPESSIRRTDAALPFMSATLKARYIDGLRKAGLPE